MKLYIVCATILAIALGYVQSLEAQTQAEFPVGIFTFGGNNVDYYQLRDTLNITWIQGHGGSGSSASDLEDNPADLRVISIREPLRGFTRSNRHRYQAEDDWPGMYVVKAFWTHGAVN